MVVERKHELFGTPPPTGEPKTLAEVMARFHGQRRARKLQRELSAAGGLDERVDRNQKRTPYREGNKSNSNSDMSTSNNDSGNDDGSSIDPAEVAESIEGADAALGDVAAALSTGETDLAIEKVDAYIYQALARSDTGSLNDDELAELRNAVVSILFDEYVAERLELSAYDTGVAGGVVGSGDFDLLDTSEQRRAAEVAEEVHGDSIDDYATGLESDHGRAGERKAKSERAELVAAVKPHVSPSDRHGVSEWPIKALRAVAAANGELAAAEHDWNDIDEHVVADEDLDEYDAGVSGGA